MTGRCSTSNAALGHYFEADSYYRRVRVHRRTSCAVSGSRDSGSACSRLAPTRLAAGLVANGSRGRNPLAIRRCSARDMRGCGRDRESRGHECARLHRRSSARPRGKRSCHCPVVASRGCSWRQALRPCVHRARLWQPAKWLDSGEQRYHFIASVCNKSSGGGRRREVHA